MNSFTRIFAFVLAGAVLVLVFKVLPVESNGNGIQCGAVLKKGKHTLTHNLYCGGSGPAITLQGGAVLDLNEFMVLGGENGACFEGDAVTITDNGCFIPEGVGTNTGGVDEEGEEVEETEVKVKYVISPSEGIVLTGRGAVLMNGTVLGLITAWCWRDKAAIL